MFDKYADVITEGRGRFDFYDNLGLPTPQVFTAYFVRELYVRSGRRAPDRKTKGAGAACDVLWWAAHEQVFKSAAGDENVGWSRHLGTAAQYRNILAAVDRDLAPMRALLNIQWARAPHNVSGLYEPQRAALAEKRFAAAQLRGGLPGSALTMLGTDRIVSGILDGAFVASR